MRRLQRGFDDIAAQVHVPTTAKRLTQIPRATQRTAVGLAVGKLRQLSWAIPAITTEVRPTRQLRPQARHEFTPKIAAIVFERVANE